MARSFKSYQEGEQVQYGEMTLKEVNDYLVLKGEMIEEPGRQTSTK